MTVPISPKVLPVLRTVTLAEMNPLARGLIFVVLGSSLSVVAIWQISRLVASGSRLGRGKVDFLTALARKRSQERDLRVVVIGGGTGLSTVLRGLKHQTSNITAVVTIADDGGSSGRLRSDLHIPPPGDARNCLVALSESEPLMEELFSYRFDKGSNLNGHSLGNLLLAALYEMRGGFEESLDSAAQLLALSGRVVPVSSERNLVLKGETVHGSVLIGESAVGHASEPLHHVWIEPESTAVSEAVLETIQQAELIVIGPGSLYTSIIPNFLVRGMREAISTSPAPKVFVCNVATQPHETDGYSVSKHIMVFQEHSGCAVTHVLVNSNVVSLAEDPGYVPIHPQAQIVSFDGAVILEDIVDPTFPTRHDPQKLASALISISQRYYLGLSV